MSVNEYIHELEGKKHPFQKDTTVMNSTKMKTANKFDGNIQCVVCSVHRRCVSLGCGLNICFHQNDPLFLFHGRYYLNSFQN